MFSDEDEDDETGGDGEIEILCPRMSARRTRKKHNTVCNNDDDNINEEDRNLRGAIPKV